MNCMSLQTSVYFGGLNKEQSFLQLNDKTFIIYARNEILHFFKNLNWEVIYSCKDYFLSNITNMKQLKNGKILCCNKDLYIYETKPKIKKMKIIKMPNFNEGEIILDVIELKNRNILGFTSQSILKFKLKEDINENDEIAQIATIDETIKDYDYIPIYRYNLNIFEITNNKLLLHYHKLEIMRRCPRSIPRKINDNKIFIMNLDNFKIIHNFVNIKNKSNVVILKNYICMSGNYGIDIYNINNYELIKTIRIDEINYILKYDDNIIIGMDEYNKSIDIVYDISDANNIKFQSIKTPQIKETYYSMNILINKLNNGKILIFDSNILYIMKFVYQFNFTPLLRKKRNK